MQKKEQAMQKKEQGALVVLEPVSFDLAPVTKKLSDLRKDNLENMDLTLSNIKIIHQATRFEMPDGEQVKAFTGVIIDFNKCNAYWEQTFDQSGGNTPPDCFSMDAVKPSPEASTLQSDFCATCPHNRFGSDGGRGKKCKNMMRIHVFTEEGQLLPDRLVLPPSNMKAFSAYTSGLLRRGYSWRQVQTSFMLREARNKDGIKYAEVVMAPVGQIDLRQVEFSSALSDMLKSRMRDIDSIGDEVYEGEMAA
jgi:hypothetical protein